MLTAHCALLNVALVEKCLIHFQTSLYFQVFLAHNNPPLASRMPRNVEQVGIYFRLLMVVQVRGVVECAGGLKLTLKDGTEVQNLLEFLFPKEIS